MVTSFNSSQSKPPTDYSLSLVMYLSRCKPSFASYQNFSLLNSDSYEGMAKANLHFLAIAVTVLAFLLSVADCSGKLEVRFLRYQGNGLFYGGEDQNDVWTFWGSQTTPTWNGTGAEVTNTDGWIKPMIKSYSSIFYHFQYKVIVFDAETNQKMDQFNIRATWVKSRKNFSEYTSTTGLHNGTTALTIEFRASCDRNFYTHNCLKYCAPADNDTDGRYTCSEEGEKICRKRWSEPETNCTVPDLCRENNGGCQHDAECQTLSPTEVQCNCTSMYQGRYCESSVFEESSHRLPWWIFFTPLIVCVVVAVLVFVGCVRHRNRVNARNIKEHTPPTSFVIHSVETVSSYDADMSRVYDTTDWEIVIT